MKQLVFSILTVMAMNFATSCSNPENEGSGEHKHEAMYQCPMKCEGDKTYSEPGQCPDCNMNLEEVVEPNHTH